MNTFARRLLMPWLSSIAIVLSATPGSGFLQAFQEKIKSAFESAAVRDALAGEVRRGRLIGGEV